MYILIKCSDRVNGPGHDEERRLVFKAEEEVFAKIIMNSGIGIEVHPSTPGDEGYHCPFCHKDIPGAKHE